MHEPVPTPDAAEDSREDEVSVVRVFGRIAPGRVIDGKYLIERELASGGVGVVVLATHLELGQRVAIKFLHSHRLSDAAVVERFKREARLAASIRSSHVVRIHDVGTLEDGAPYMVMEYLEGEDLGAVLARCGPISVDVAIDWILQACEALMEAHALGIVHRDLKPENLFLAKTGVHSSIVKIVDFGISKVHEDPSGTSAPARVLGSARSARMTEENERFGTPVYMSPEQLASSTNVDARSDIWSLAVVLFELLTADLPFEGHDLTSLLSNVLTSSPVPIRRKRPDVSPAIESILLACLARDRNHRPAGVAELAGMLAPFATPMSGARPLMHHLAHATPNAAFAPMPIPNAPARAALGDAATLSHVGMGSQPRLAVTMSAGPRKTHTSALFLVLSSIIALAGAAAIVLFVSTFARGTRSSILAAPAKVDGRSGLVASAAPPAASSSPARILPALMPPKEDAPPPAVQPSAKPVVQIPSPRTTRAPAATTPASARPTTPAPPPRSDYDDFGGRQ